SEISHCRGPADRRHVAEIPIREGSVWLPSYCAVDIASHVTAHLDGHLRNARQLTSIRAGKACEIADYEYFFVSRDRQVRFNQPAAGAIERGAQRRAKW